MVAALLPFAESIRSGFRGLSALRSGVFASLGALLLFTACLYDEIPAALAVAGTILLGVDFLAQRESAVVRACRATLIALIAVVVVFAWWDLVGFPKMVWAITGERAWMNFQTGTARALFRQPSTLLTGAVSMFADTFGFLMGGISALLAIVAMLGLTPVWDDLLDGSEGESLFLSAPRSLLRKQHAIRRIALGALLTIGILYGMVARHPPIMAIDVRRTSYVLAFTTIFLCVLAATLARALQKGIISSGAAALTLTILILSNIASLPAQRRVLISHSHDSIELTRVLLAKLHKPWLPLPDFPSPPNFERLLKEVPNNKIYQALRPITPQSPESPR